MDAADQVVSVKKLLVKSGKFVLISKDPSIAVAGSDPVNSGDSSLVLEFSGDATGSATYALPSSHWGATGTGFNYKNDLAPNGPSGVKIAKVKAGLLKVVGKVDPFTVPTGNFSAIVRVHFNLAGTSNVYCMRVPGFSSSEKFLSKNAPAVCCGNDIAEGDPSFGGEHCDGSDDSFCPGLCLPDCTCDFSAPACCNTSAGCQAGRAEDCIPFATPMGGDLVCADSGCVSSASMPDPTLCCEDGFSCRVDGSACFGPPFLGVCSPSGRCEPNWVLGALGQDCDAACASIGRAFDVATTSYAGSAGTDAHCTYLLDQLGAAAGSLTTIPCTGGLGCNVTLGGRFRCTMPTTSSASGAFTQRVCACH